MPIFLLLALPLVEIALFIWIGNALGLLPTLLSIVAMAFAGVALLRHAPLQRGRIDPGRMLAEGAFRTMGALLLILPGFLTGAIGVVLLLPPVQRALMRRLGNRLKRARTVDAEFTVHDGERLFPPRDIGSDQRH
jgi:UPF0716 protein FxsA